MINRNEFIATIAPLIVKEGKKRGYHVFSPVIAQAICESNWGQSKLSANYHNFFGLKCGSKWKGACINMKTKEEYKGTLTTIKDNFRSYPSVKDGVAGYYDFISTKRYENLKYAYTPLQYCQYLKDDGYATSSSYVNTLMNIIEKNNLTKYDGVTMQIVDSYYKDVSDIVDEVIAGKWGNGMDRKQRLAAAGYDYTVIQKLVNQKVRGR